MLKENSSPTPPTALAVDKSPFVDNAQVVSPLPRPTGREKTKSNVSRDLKFTDVLAKVQVKEDASKTFIAQEMKEVKGAIRSIGKYTNLLIQREEIKVVKEQLELEKMQLKVQMLCDACSINKENTIPPPNHSNFLPKEDRVVVVPKPAEKKQLKKLRCIGRRH